MPQCKAKSKRSGDQCRRESIPGGTVCAVHGGSAPLVRQKAAERLLELKLHGEVQKLTIEPVTDPVAWYQDVAGEVQAFLTLCRSEMGRLHKLDYEDARAVQDVKAAVALYERALDRAEKTADHMISRGIEAKVAQRASVDAAHILAILTRLLDSLDVPAVDRPALIREALEV